MRLVFGGDGALLGTTTARSPEQPAYPPDAIYFPIHPGRVTRAAVASYLDWFRGTGRDRTTFELYGAMRRRPLEEEVPDGQ